MEYRHLHLYCLSSLTMYPGRSLPSGKTACTSQVVKSLVPVLCLWCKSISTCSAGKVIPHSLLIFSSLCSLPHPNIGLLLLISISAGLNAPASRSPDWLLLSRQFDTNFAAVSSFPLPAHSSKGDCERLLGDALMMAIVCIQGWNDGDDGGWRGC